MLKEVRIKFWSISKNVETGTTHIYGNVYGHPKCEDGNLKTSASLINIDPEFKYVETKNTRYILE